MLPPEISSRVVFYADTLVPQTVAADSDYTDIKAGKIERMFCKLPQEKR